MRALKYSGIALLAGAVLAGIFMLYGNPHFMVRLADLVWACF